MIRELKRESIHKPTAGLAALGRAGIALLCFYAFSRPAPLGGASPFSAALFAAGLAAGEPGGPLLLLLGAGAPWDLNARAALSTLLACALGWGIFALVKRMPTGLRARLFARASGEDAAAAMLALICSALSQLPLLGPENWAPAVSPLIAAALSPVLLGAVRRRERLRSLTDDEGIAVSLCGFLLLAGLCASPLRPLSIFLSALLPALLSRRGAGWGAAAGALAGAALYLGGGEGTLFACLTLSGLAAGLSRPLDARLGAAAFLAGFMAPLAAGLPVHPHGALCALPAALLRALLPESALSALTPGAPAGEENDARLWDALAGGGEKRLRALAAVFDEMAEGLGTAGAPVSESEMLSQMRRALCAGCPSYEACWGGARPEAARLFPALIVGAFAGEELSPEAELPPEIARRCRRGAEIPRRLYPLLRDFRARAARAELRAGAGGTLSGHYREAARILTEAAAREIAAPRLDGRLARGAMAALHKAGIRADGAMALVGEGAELSLSLAGGAWDAEKARAACRALQSALRIAFRPAGRAARGTDRVIRLVEAPRLRAVVGCARRPRTGGAVSGDSHLASGLPGARVMLALSDGMGSGERAAAESGCALRLLRRFLLAGVGCELALRAVNRLLLLRGGDEMYATCDLLVAELNRGEARFFKLGACSSYIIRGKSCIRIGGGRLPLGILETVEPIESACPLKAGDSLVMLTDGIPGADGSEDEGWLLGTLRSLRDEEPAELARKLVAEARRLNRAPADDMTALVLRISESNDYYE